MGKVVACWACSGTGWAHVPDLEDPFVEAMVLPKRKCRNCAGKGHFPIHDDAGVVNLIEQKRWFTDRQHRLRRVTEREVLPAA